MSDYFMDMEMNMKNKGYTKSNVDILRFSLVGKNVEYDRFIKPENFKGVYSQIVELTGITDADVASGISLFELLADLNRILSKRDKIYCWGDFDGYSLRSNIRRYKNKLDNTTLSVKLLQHPRDLSVYFGKLIFDEDYKIYKLGLKDVAYALDINYSYSHNSVEDAMVLQKVYNKRYRLSNRKISLLKDFYITRKYYNDIIMRIKSLYKHGKSIDDIYSLLDRIYSKDDIIHMISSNFENIKFRITFPEWEYRAFDYISVIPIYKKLIEPKLISSV